MLDYQEIKRRLNRFLQILLAQEQNDFSPAETYEKLSEAAGFEFSPAVVHEAYAHLSGAIVKGGRSTLLRNAEDILRALVDQGVFTAEKLTPENALLVLKTYYQTCQTFHDLMAKRDKGDYELIRK